MRHSGFRLMLSGEKRGCKREPPYVPILRLEYARVRLKFQVALTSHDRHSGERRNPVKYSREAHKTKGQECFARVASLDPGVRRDDGTWRFRGGPKFKSCIGVLGRKSGQIPEFMDVVPLFLRTAVRMRRDDGLKSSCSRFAIATAEGEIVASDVRQGLPAYRPSGA